ncbi:hypothetical protein ACM66B_000893 [Microbotryomycetes sp. NB124-2]
MSLDYTNGTRSALNDSAQLRHALQDVVTFTNPGTAQHPHEPDMARSGTSDSLIDAYRDAASDTASSPLDRSRSHSPVQTRPKMPTKSASSRDAPAEAGRKRKPHVPLDVIDKMDVSGLYGGGALARHDGPFAAAAASRQKGSRAPMAAFDASSLAPPPTAAFAGPARAQGQSPRSVSASAASSQNLSPRAAAALAAMHGHDLAHGASLTEGPYAAAAGLPRTGRRNSDSSLNSGHLTKQGNGKGAQYIEMYGVRDSEAWEDFGTQERERVYGQMSRESVVPSVTSKRSERSAKAQSVWDIEATLAAGKPVAQQAPPVPVIPDNQSTADGSSPDGRPKRSKSLAARLRPSRKTSQTHVADTTTDGQATPLRDANGRYDDSSPHHSQSRQRSATLTSSNRRQPLEDEFEHLSIGGDQHLKATSPASPVDRFKEQEGGYFGGSGEQRSDGADVQRRPSALKRLFSKRRNDKAT